MKQEVEKNIIIAKRVPPGDQWEVSGIDETSTYTYRCFKCFLYECNYKTFCF
jgi:hypothetical protein